jgi:hypothetical protein
MTYEERLKALLATIEAPSFPEAVKLGETLVKKT